jgi:aminoglycoside phosphotransferase (APT) family kinase protein
MEKVPGPVIRTQPPDGYARSPIEKVALANALVDVLADLHAIDPKAIGLADYRRPYGYVEREILRWSSRWEKTKTHEVKAVDELGWRLKRVNAHRK